MLGYLGFETVHFTSVCAFFMYSSRTEDYRIDLESRCLRSHCIVIVPEAAAWAEEAGWREAMEKERGQCS